MEVTMLLSQRLPLVSSLCQKGIQCEAGGQSCDAFGLKFLRSRFLWSEIEHKKNLSKGMDSVGWMDGWMRWMRCVTWCDMV